jgi:hypothetical protein
MDIRRRRCHDSVRGATSAVRVALACRAVQQAVHGPCDGRVGVGDGSVVHRTRPHVAEPAMSSAQHAGFPQRSPRPTSTPDGHASSLPARPAQTGPLPSAQAHRTTSQLSHSQPRPAPPCRAHGASGCSATPDIRRVLTPARLYPPHLGAANRFAHTPQPSNSDGCGVHQSQISTAHSTGFSGPHASASRCGWHSPVRMDGHASSSRDTDLSLQRRKCGDWFLTIE